MAAISAGGEQDNKPCLHAGGWCGVDGASCRSLHGIPLKLEARGWSVISSGQRCITVGYGRTKARRIGAGLLHNRGCIIEWRLVRGLPLKWMVEMALGPKEDARLRRNGLIDAAERVFCEKGVSRASLGDIASAAGATRAGAVLALQR